MIDDQAISVTGGWKARSTLFSQRCNGNEGKTMVRIHFFRLLLIYWVLCSLVSTGPVSSQSQDAHMDSVPARSLKWSPDGSKIAVGYQNGIIEILDASTGTVLIRLAGHSAPVVALDWDYTSTLIASGALNPDNTLRLWNALNGEQTALYSDFGLDVLAVEWKPDGTQVLAAAAEGLTSEGNTVFVDVQTNTTQLLSLGTVNDMQWSADETQILIATPFSIKVVSAFNPEQTEIEYLIPQQNARPHFLNQPLHVEASTDDTRIAVAIGDGRMLVFSARPLAFIAQLEAHNYRGTVQTFGAVNALQWSTNDDLLSTISGNGTVRSWNYDLTPGLEYDAPSNIAADFSAYGGQIAIGAPSEATEGELLGNGNTGFSGLPIQILVPDPTPARLLAIADACDAPPAVVEAVTALAAQPADGPELLDASLYSALTASRVASLDAVLDAQPTAALAPGCAADLRAVAEAMAANAGMNAGK